jgi:hypothetical protein
VSAPQGLVRFGNVEGILAAGMTLTPGVSPSVCSIDCAAPQTNLRSDSDLIWTYGSTAFRFRFCRLDQIEPTIDSEGRQVLRLTILDRRWRWVNFGSVSGVYNTRRGESVIREKKPSELLKLCFDALGERNYDLSGVNAETEKLRPAIDWDHERPGQALAKLCDDLGVVPCLGLDDRIHLFTKGNGRDLQINGAIEAQAGYDPPDWPAEIKIVGAVTRHQQDLELEAVGRDTDGKIKPLDELSYKPEKGFGDIESFVDVKEGLDRKYAQESVYRWYRIKTPFKVTATNEEIKQIDRVLPLFSEQVETYEDDNVKRNRPPWVYGDYLGREDAVEAAEQGTDRRLANQPKTLYPKSFSVDSERGIVKFSEPVYRYKKDNNEQGALLFAIVPAKIKLRTAFGVRNEKTNQFLRYEYSKRNPQASGRVSNPPTWSKRFEKFDDVQVNYYEDYSTGRMVLVKDESKGKEMADYYWGTVAQQYQPKQSVSATFPGLLSVASDGAISQVTWSINSDGSCTTRISRNREEVLLAPAYKERRLLETLQAVAKQQKLTPGQQAQRQQLARQ